MYPRLLLSLFALSLLLSFPSLLRIPRILPLLQADVRKAAPGAIEVLRAKGLWLVNVDLAGIERKDKNICFFWEHQYTARAYTDPPELLTTCIDVQKI